MLRIANRTTAFMWILPTISTSTPLAGGSPFSNDEFHDVFLVVNQGLVPFYLDGSAQASIATSSMDANLNLFGFFLDNLVGGGQGEYSSGSVALINLYNVALNAGEITPPGKTAANAVLDTLIEAIQVAVKKGDAVQLIGFGTFKSAKRAARTGKNPSTGAALKIPATTVPKFVAGAKFKAAVDPKATKLKAEKAGK